MVNTDLKMLLNSIKARYATKESSFEFFLLHSDKLNIYNTDYRKGFVDMRGEKTPSTIINPYLTYCDFGDDGERHDIIYRIQELYNVNFPKAVKMLAEWVGEKITEIPKEFKAMQKKEEKKRNPYTAGYLKEKRKNAVLNSQITSELMQGLCRGCTIEEQRIAYSRFFIGLDSYEKSDGTTVFRLFIPEKDMDNIPWGSFRYNRSLDPKGLLRKNSKRVLFGSHLMKYFNPNKPIIFTEGHSDTIVCNAKNIAAITTGSATTKIGNNIGYLKGKTLHFYPDCDEAGLKGVSKKIIEINKYNAQLSNPEDKIKYKIFWWAYNFVSKDNLLVDINYLYKIQQELYNKEKYQPLFEDLITNWKVIISSKQYVKQGFDFIDFFQEYFGTTSLKRFQEKYSYII